MYCDVYLDMENISNDSKKSVLFLLWIFSPYLYGINVWFSGRPIINMVIYKRNDYLIVGMLKW